MSVRSSIYLFPIFLSSSLDISLFEFIISQSSTSCPLICLFSLFPSFLFFSLHFSSLLPFSLHLFSFLLSPLSYLLLFSSLFSPLVLLQGGKWLESRPINIRWTHKDGHQSLVWQDEHPSRSILGAGIHRWIADVSMLCVPSLQRCY